VASEKAVQRWGYIPGTSREIDNGRARVVPDEPFHEYCHTGHSASGVFVSDERIPRSKERPWQRSHHDGVIDVTNDTDAGFGRDHGHFCAGRFRVVGPKGERMPAGGEFDGNYVVDHPTAVGFQG
jgi:hypothetical protein